MQVFEGEADSGARTLQQLEAGRAGGTPHFPEELELGEQTGRMLSEARLWTVG